MSNCSKCKNRIVDGEESSFQGEILCDDCYIDRIWPKVRKTYYENDPAGFLRRLQESYSTHPQRFH